VPLECVAGLTALRLSFHPESDRAITGVGRSRQSERATSAGPQCCCTPAGRRTGAPTTRARRIRF
jgi:hypothetical protein